MKAFAVTIEGNSPLLQARHPTPEQAEKIQNRSSRGGKKVKNVTDEEQFEMHAYKKDGKFFQPGEMIEAALVKAATQWKMEGKKTYKDVFKAGMFVSPVEIIHEVQDFKPDARWGKNPSTGGAIWVVRPCIQDGWRLSFTINVPLHEKIPDHVLQEALEYAGAYVGIGAWRPKFGRFTIKKFEEITSK